MCDVSGHLIFNSLRSPSVPQTAKQHLQLALEAAAAVGSSVTEWEIAEHHYKLGRVLWELGGDDRQQAWPLPWLLSRCALICCCCIVAGCPPGG